MWNSRWSWFKALQGLSLLLLPIVVSCGSAAQQTPPPPGTATSGAPTAAATPTRVPAAAPQVNPGKLTVMVGDLSNELFDTVFAPGGPAPMNYSRIIGGYLISTNAKRQMVPGIASQWALSTDGLTWTFTVRKGVKWHDGSEVTPEDVLWTLQHSFGPQAAEYAISTPAVRISRAMDRIEMSGPDKVSVISKQPVLDIGVQLAESGDAWFQVLPKRATLHDTEQEKAYDLKPIGTGSMRLVKRVQASAMNFERFDDYYYQPKNGFAEDRRVNFKALDLVLVPEEATRVAAIRAGDADIAPASLATRKQVEAGGGRVVFGQEGVFVWVLLPGCWETKYPCHDKRVRQALDYAIDKELIRDKLYGGPDVFQVKGWSVVTPSTIGYTPALDPWPFDPNKARQLLADAGYPGGRGFGKLKVYTYPSSSMPLQVEAAQLGAEFWKRELGLDVEVVAGDSTAIKKQWRSGELNGQILWREDDTRVDTTAKFSNDYSDPKSLSRMHEDPELFRVVQEAVRTVDPDKRADAYTKLFPRLRDESHWLSIGYANIPWAVGRRVVTWQPYPLALFPSALHTITLK